MWTLDAEITAARQLRTEGPYRVTRHPIYTGILGMLLGSLPLDGIGRAVLLLPVGYVLFKVKIDAEEALMVTAFPDEYAAYCRRIAQLIPVTRRARQHQRMRKPGRHRRRRWGPLRHMQGRCAKRAAESEAHGVSWPDAGQQAPVAAKARVSPGD
jgi:isoprenylcysteine carboxyl methyltransferase (ICMT) family protein